MERHKDLCFWAALALMLAGTGCGHGQFETARTLKRGQKALTAGITGVVNENTRARGPIPTSFPSEFKMRFGIHDRMDMSLGLFLLTGVQWHAKVNLMPPECPLAIAVQMGISGAVLPFQFDETVPWVLRAPINLLASVDIAKWFTPHIGAGYQFWWFFKMQRSPNAQLEPGYEWVERKGYGDGVVRLLGGLAFHTSERRTLMLEYAALIPVVNDLGDNFKFVLNHHFGIALQHIF